MTQNEKKIKPDGFFFDGFFASAGSYALQLPFSFF